MVNILGLNFHLYGFLIGLGMLSALEISVRLAKIRGVEESLVRRLFWWVIVFGIIGARVYHVVDYWQEYYQENLIQIVSVWNGGLGIWGAIVGGFVGLLIYKSIYRVDKIFDWLDIGFIGLPIAQAIGRLGNYFNQELYGRETSLPWGLIIDGKQYHPLFAYEGILNLVLFVILWKLRKQKSGIISGVYLIGYGLIRFSLEGLRITEMVWRVGNMPVAVLMSVGAIFVGGVIIWKRK